MRHRTLVIAAAAVLFAGGVGYLAGRGGHAAPETPSPTTASAGVPFVAPVEGMPPGRAAGRQAAAPQADAPLPDPETPLLQIHDTLVRRAATGDARAACRLAAEHERCESSRQQLRAVDAQKAQMTRSLERQSTVTELMQQRATQARNRLRGRRDSLAPVLANCEAVPPLSPTERTRYWRQAALAGHLPAMRHYASGSAFRLHELMDTLPALQVYRREAEPIALRAASHGDVASMYALALAYASFDDGRRRSFLAQSVTPDLPRALGWFTALAQQPAIAALPDRHPVALNVARHLAELQAAATPDEVAQANRLAATVQVRATEPRDALMLVDNGSVRDVRPDACDAEPLAATR
ncbi:conserved hypothetical protein [Luteimonas sp. 9C]|uniref:hypothetical protein n=1 Tax=Luteimonas sp. 9C TaxID=2653148 RepID=UPI0012F441C6|nr:hypothetical protein [Luteimonas sp. 9C]VXB06832.1 conserved hypothetical protein [Luteimonas sp. 9C]